MAWEVLISALGTLIKSQDLPGWGWMSVALLFPGQGAQNVGMGLELCRLSSRARALFAQASEILGFDLLEICVSGPADTLHKTQNSQPALFVHSLAALQQFCEDRPGVWDDVSAVAGLSLGEYTAIAAAGGLSFEEGVRLVQVRGQAMQSAADKVQSGMSSVLGLSLEKLESVCQQATAGLESFVKPANLLCPGNIAISGHLDALSRAESLASEAGAMRTIRLPVAGAFHTRLMQPAVAPLSEALMRADFSPTRVPVLSNVDAASHSQPTEFRRLLPMQVVEPVLWEKTVLELISQGVERFIEIGTGRVLAGTVKRINRKIPCENYGDAI